MLLQNATNYASNPITLTGGTLAGEAVYLGFRDQTFLAFAASVHSKSAIPEGYGPLDAWFPAIRKGGLGAGSESELVATAIISGARNLEASATVELTGTAIGSLIASMTASSTMTLTTSADIFAIQIASIDATASISLSGTASASAFAIMSASSVSTLTGAVAQRANAFMVASAGGPEALSPEGLAAAVWNALSNENNLPGTMGEKLNAAGAAADPWSVELESGFTADRILRIVASVVAGKSTGGPGGPVFRNLADSQDQVTGVATVDGNRGSVTYGS